MLHRRKFEEQERWLREHGPVYGEVRFDLGPLARWISDAEVAAVPPPILDTIVAVPLNEEPGKVVGKVAAEATAQREEADEDVRAA